MALVRTAATGAAPPSPDAPSGAPRVVVERRHRQSKADKASRRRSKLLAAGKEKLAQFRQERRNTAKDPAGARGGHSPACAEEATRSPGPGNHSPGPASTAADPPRVAVPEVSGAATLTSPPRSVGDASPGPAAGAAEADNPVSTPLPTAADGVATVDGTPGVSTPGSGEWPSPEPITAVASAPRLGGRDEQESDVDEESPGAWGTRTAPVHAGRQLAPGTALQTPVTAERAPASPVASNGSARMQASELEADAADGSPPDSTPTVSPGYGIQDRIAAAFAAAGPAPRAAVDEPAVPASPTSDAADAPEAHAAADGPRSGVGSSDQRALQLAHAEIAAHVESGKRLQEENCRLREALRRLEEKEEASRYAAGRSGSQADLLTDVVADVDSTGRRARSSNSDADPAGAASPGPASPGGPSPAAAHRSIDFRASPTARAAATATSPAGEREGEGDAWSRVLSVASRGCETTQALAAAMNRGLQQWRDLEDGSASAAGDPATSHASSIRQHLRQLIGARQRDDDNLVNALAELGQPVSLDAGSTWASAKAVEDVVAARLATERVTVESLMSDHARLQTKLEAYQTQVRSLTRDLAVTRRDAEAAKARLKAAAAAGRAADSGLSAAAAAVEGAGSMPIGAGGDADGSLWAENARLRGSVAEQQRVIEEKAALTSSLRRAVGVAAAEAHELRSSNKELRKVKDNLMEALSEESRRSAALQKQITDKAQELRVSRAENDALRQGVDEKERRIHQLLEYSAALEARVRTPAVSRVLGPNVGAGPVPTPLRTPGAHTPSFERSQRSDDGDDGQAAFGGSGTPGQVGASPVLFGGPSPIGDPSAAASTPGSVKSEPIEPLAGKTSSPPPPSPAPSAPPTLAAAATADSDSGSVDWYEASAARGSPGDEEACGIAAHAVLREELSKQRAAYDSEVARLRQAERTLQGRVAQLESEVESLTAELRRTLAPSLPADIVSGAATGAASGTADGAATGTAGAGKPDSAAVSVNIDQAAVSSAQAPPWTGSGASIIAADEHKGHAAAHRARVEAEEAARELAARRGFWAALLDLMWPLVADDDDDAAGATK